MRPILLRVLFCFCLLSALCGAVLPGTLPAMGQQNCRRFGNIDVCGRFLDEWSKLGSDQASLYANGLPITPRRPEISMDDGKTYDTQWFERARFEAHPEKPAPYDVLLGLLGANLAEGRTTTDPATGLPRNPSDQPFIGVNKPGDADGVSKLWFPETRHSVSGKILEYWNKYGGLKQFGFPLSEQFQQVSPTDGKTYTVQYFERNRFELHPENQAPYEVQLGLLGKEQYLAAAVPPHQLPIAPPKDVRTEDDSAVIGLARQPDSFVDLADTSPEVRMVRDIVQDELIGEDYKENYFPELAYFVPTLENGGSYWVGVGDDRHLVTKYKIRQGIKWSDGADFTSSDVVFTYNLIMNPDTPVADRALYEKVYNVVPAGSHTVIFNWLAAPQAAQRLQSDPNHFAFLKPFADGKKPVTDPLYFLVGTPTYPEHVLNKVPSSRILDSPYATNPVGTGPFRLDKWQRDEEMDFVQNDYYTLTGRPLIRRLTIKFVLDSSQLPLRMVSGELDAVANDAYPVPSDGLDQISPDVYKAEYVPGHEWEHLDFNFAFPAFQDHAVREAIITAINRQGMVDKIMRGKTVVMNTVQPPASWVSLQNPDFARKWSGKYALPAYGYDVARANKLLDDAGWLPGPDGIRAKGDQKLSFEYGTTTGSKMRASIAQQVQSDLRAVGISVQIRYYNSCPGCGNSTENPPWPRFCQLCEFAWSPSPGADPDFSQWDSANKPAGGDYYTVMPLRNYQDYKNPAVDDLARTFSGEIERAKREEAGAQLQVLLMQDIPAIPLFPRPNIEVHKSRLVNWKTSPGTVSPFYNVTQWYFSK